VYTYILYSSLKIHPLLQPKQSLHIPLIQSKQSAHTSSTQDYTVRTNTSSSAAYPYILYSSLYRVYTFILYNSLYSLHIYPLQQPKHTSYTLPTQTSYTESTHTSSTESTHTSSTADYTVYTYILYSSLYSLHIHPLQQPKQSTHTEMPTLVNGKTESGAKHN